jgi:hypothetical protein
VIFLALSCQKKKNIQKSLNKNINLNLFIIEVFSLNRYLESAADLSIKTDFSFNNN